MEIINVKKLEQKGTMLIVDYTVQGIAACPVSQATMNTGWQAQEIDFMTKDVGVGGKVEVEIKHKPNPKNPQKPWVNITKVNMNDNWTKGLGAPVETVLPDTPVIPKKSISTQDSIVAQCIMKEANNLLCAYVSSGVELEQNKYGEFLCDNVKELLGAYRVALDGLK